MYPALAFLLESIDVNWLRAQRVGIVRGTLGTCMTSDDGSISFLATATHRFGYSRRDFVDA